MSLGLGIFLSVLLISFIFFPQQLLGRSKKFLKFILLPVIILISVISLFSYLYDLYVYKTPRLMHSYWDINIGDSLKEVNFLKGNTNWATGEIIRWDFEGNKVSKWEKYRATTRAEAERRGMKISDQMPTITKEEAERRSYKPVKVDNFWEELDNQKKTNSLALKYRKEYDRKKYLIQFSKNNKVKEISCTGDYFCPKIASIGIDSTWKELIRIFGSPEYGYRDCDNGTRKVCYPKYNVCFALEKSKVYYISVVRKWNAKDYYNYGKLIAESHEKKNHAYAIKAFDKAIEIDQNNPKAYVAKGWELYQLGKYKEAIELYNKAISLDFTSANLYNYLGLALKNLNKEREAIKAYEEAIKLDKKFKSPYTNMARIYASQKQYNKALEYINIGIGLQESGDLLAFDLVAKGRYLYELHHYDEAIKAYEESILSATSDMNKSYPYHGIGLCLLALGNKEEAIEAINKAIDLNPSYNDEFRKTLKSALGQ